MLGLPKHLALACGRTCKEMKIGICLTVNEGRAGGAYGYLDVGGWVSGQAEYVLVPYADFNLLKFPNKDQAVGKVRDLTMLSDIFPTGFHGAVKAGVGLAAASAQLLGAAVVTVGDMDKARLAHARSFGCETLGLNEDANLADQIANTLGVPEIDCAIDSVGFEASVHGAQAKTEVPAAVLNSLMEIARAGGATGIPGLYVTDAPGAKEAAAKTGNLSTRFGLGWAKSHSFHTGQTPVSKLQPPAHAGHFVRQSADCQGRERGNYQPLRGPQGLRRVRQRRGPEVCHQPPQPDSGREEGQGRQGNGGLLEAV